MRAFVFSAYLVRLSIPLQGELQVRPRGTLEPPLHLAPHQGNHPGQQRMP